MNFRPMFSAALAACVLTMTGVALAQSETVDREADDRFRRGVALMKDGHADEARLMFMESYTVDPQPKTLWNLAGAELASHRMLDALGHLRKWLREPGADVTKREFAKNQISKILAETSHLAVDGANVDELLIDGKPAAGAEHDGSVYDVSPGHHSLEVTTGGHEKREIDIAAGATVPVHFTTRAPAPAPTRPPLVHVESTPAAREYPFWTTRRIVALGLGVGAIASFGVATGFGLAAKSDEDRFTSLNGKVRGCDGSPSAECNDLHDALDAQRTHAGISNVFLVSGGVLALGSLGVLASLAFAPEHPEKEHTAFAPLVVRGGGGISVSGGF